MPLLSPINPLSTTPGLSLVEGSDMKQLFDAANNSGSVVTTDNGTTQTLTTAMVTGGAEVFHLSSGGSTPTLTMPTAAAIIAAIPGVKLNQSYLLRFINANSGTATIAAGTGITTTGTLTLATNTTRDFLITYTAANALSMVSVGTGTNS